MPGIIPGTIGGRRVDIVTKSGMLLATVHPSAHWLAGLVTLVGDAIFAAILY